MATSQMKILTLLLFCSVWVADALKKDTPIIIVGAGAAGISALSKLMENGFSNVTLLEAENRIGGRIYTVPFASSVMDLGAQWVHGDKGNIIWEMIKNENLLGITPMKFFQGWFTSSEGTTHRDYQTIFEVCEWIYRELDGCEEFWATPYGKYFMDEFDREMRRIRYREVVSQNKIDFVRYYEKVVSLDDSSDSWFKTSTSGCSEYVDLPGVELQNWKDKGFHTVFDFITKKRPDPSKDLKVESRIRLNKEVSLIDYRDAHINKITVSCVDGSVYEAAHVIVTVPIGVLRAQHRSMFAPPLSLRKINAIDHIQFGTLDKIGLEYTQPFWPSSWDGFSMIWTPAGLSKIIGTPYEWTKGLIGFWRVSYQPNMLCGWIVGPDARQMELLSDEEIQKGVMFVFNEFIGGRINYTTPNRIMPSRWDSNPHFRGSYTSRSVETDLNNAFAFDMSLPMNSTSGRPAVLFAGESSHPKFYSAVHGAIETGYREAQRLINLR